MNQEILISSRDSFLVGVPFLAIMVLFVFRLDHVLFRSDVISKRQRRGPCGVDANGEMILCDPDGRPSRGRETN